MALGKHPGVDQHLAQVVLVAAGSKLVQQVMSEWLAGRGELAEELGARAALQPAGEASRVLCRGEGVLDGPKLGCDLAVGSASSARKRSSRTQCAHLPGV